MIELLLTTVYILLFAFFDLNITFYLFIGLAILSFVRGFQDKKVSLLAYFKLFEKKYTLNNFFQLIASILFVCYFFLKSNLFYRLDSFITIPSLTIYIFFLVFYTEGRE